MAARQGSLATRPRPDLAHLWRRPLRPHDDRGRHWLHPIGRRAQLQADATIGRANYARNDLQDGTIYDLGLAYERALTPRSGVRLSLSVNRQIAADPGYSTASGGIGALYWRDLGKTTLFGAINLRHLEADARLFPFKDKRREWLYSANAGATFRQLTLAGFAPVLRATFERNQSTVGIYDYKRRSIELGITRAF